MNRESDGRSEMNSKLVAAAILAGLGSPALASLFGDPGTVVINDSKAIAELEAESVIDRRLIEKAQAKHRRRYMKRLELEKAK